MNIRMPLIMFIAAALLCNCGKDVAGGSGAGNPGAVATLSIQAIDSSTALARTVALSTLTIPDAAGAQFRLDTALIRVDSIIFITKGNVPDTALYGSFTFDLISGTVFPPLTVHLQSALYEGMDIYVNTDDSLLHDITLAGLSGINAMPFHFGIDYNQETVIHQRFPNDSAMPLNDADSVRLIVRLPVSDWFSGIDFADSMAIMNNHNELDTSDGVIAIDGGTGAIAKSIRQRMLNVDSATNVGSNELNIDRDWHEVD